MKNYGNQILGTIITFLLTLFLSFATHLFFLKTGSVELRNYKKVGGEYVSQIRVENYSTENINGLKILIPSTTDLSKITATNTVEIESSNPMGLSDKNQQLVEISLFPAKSITTLFIPTTKDTECCSVLNLTELKLESKSGYAVENPVLKAFYDGLLTALIYSIFAAIIFFWHKTQMIEVEKTIEDFRGKAQEARQEIKEVKEEFGEHLKTDARKSAILIRRLSDYSKELTFWRDTIRKVLYEQSSASTAEKLLSTVTKTLKTFGTQDRFHREHEIAEALAETIIEHEGTHIKKNNL